MYVPILHCYKSLCFVVVFIANCMFVNYLCFKWFFSFAYDLKMKLFLIRFPSLIEKANYKFQTIAKVGLTAFLFKANKNT